MPQEVCKPCKERGRTTPADFLIPRYRGNEYDPWCRWCFQGAKSPGEDFKPDKKSVTLPKVAAERQLQPRV